MKSLVILTFALVACGGLEAPGIECASTTATRRCDQGGVYVVDGTDTHGTITSCKATCVIGAACTFTTDNGFQDGVCQ